MSHLTQVLYFVPEDNEDHKNLNCFVIKQDVNKITLKDIRAQFPLPGDYHFRFQFVYQATTVWLDLTNDKCALPNIDGQIVMKVLRIHWKKTTEAVESCTDESLFLKQEAIRSANQPVQQASLFDKVKSNEIYAEGQQFMGNLFNKAKNFMESQTAAVAQPKQKTIDDLFY